MAHKLLHFANEETGDEYVVLDTGGFDSEGEMANEGFILKRAYGIADFFDEWPAELPTDVELRKERFT